MPARDRYHDAVRAALIKDGWTITDDPYTIPVGSTDVYVDLGAERIAAERGTEKIAVEIKVFGGPSLVRDLETALGQYLLYRLLLTDQDPERKPFLAVTQEVAIGPLEESISRRAIEGLNISLLIFDPQREIIVKWKP